MHTASVRIPTADGHADGFAAWPDGGERHPAVLLYSDAFGLRPELERKARELAGHGYYVLVPNIYYRHSGAPVLELPEHIGEQERPAVFAQVKPLVEGLTSERALADATAYLDFLAAQPEVSHGPVAAIGYCLGAVLAVRTATAHPDRVAAVAGFHPGGLVTDEPDSPHHRVPDLTAEVHLGLAEGDMSTEAREQFNRALDSAGVAHTIETYPDTVHGFTMSDTDAFDPSALQRHWDHLLPLLERRLSTVDR